MTSTPTKPVDNVVIVTKGLQDRNTNVTVGTTVENKGKLILVNTSLLFLSVKVFLLLFDDSSNALSLSMFCFKTEHVDSQLLWYCHSTSRKFL